jgi:alanine racemase
MRLFNGMTQFASPLRLKLDGDTLVSNWRFLKRQGTADCGAAVKANAYGLGAREVVPLLAAAGCRQFFVAHWAEAAAIADLVPPDQIAVLNGFDADDPSDALRIGAVPVLNTPMQIARWKAAGGCTCHVMLDSGINRLGIGVEQMNADLFDGLEIDILLSHLASADEDVPQNAEQLTLFRHLTSSVSAKRKSLANSAGIMLGTDYHFHLMRPGLALYGGIARPEMAGSILPVVTPQSSVLQVRTVPAGSPVGYNATYETSAPTRVATLAIGYADGYWRALSGKGNAIYEGQTLPVIGRVSMDLLLVNANSVPQLREGDWVDIGFDLPTTSVLSGMSQYELLTGLADRAERHWI